MTTGVRVLLVWHVHGSWTQSLGAGPHRYLIPVSPPSAHRPLDVAGAGYVPRHAGGGGGLDDGPLVVPAEAEVVSADVKTLAYALEGSVTDLPAATAAGKAARDFAAAHFALDRFLADWDALVDEVCG